MCLKTMSVMPDTVWPGSLHIDKTMWRLPSQDLGLPANWNSMETKLIADFSPWFYGIAINRQDPEMQPRRSDFLQIACVRKETEDLIQRARNPLFPA
jgi:hypothetical protein